jgi:ribosome-associated protein
MLVITETISIPDQEAEFVPIRASGPGGQHVNKVSSAVHLRLDINMSSLPEHCKKRLLNMADRRITEGGIIVIKAGQFRSLEQNKADALQRLRLLIAGSLKQSKKRIPTRPSKRSQTRRLEKKQQQSKRKSLRRRITSFE